VQSLNTLSHKRREIVFIIKERYYIQFGSENTLFEQNRNVLNKNNWHLKTALISYTKFKKKCPKTRIIL